MMEGLEDDGSEVFKGGTLEIHQENWKASKENSQENLCKGGNQDNANKSKIWNGITPIIAIPKKITDTLWNSDSQTTQRNTTSTQIVPVLKAESPSDFFTFRDGVVEKAVKECIDLLINSEADGQVLGTFLLTEISLWDTEKERLVLVTSNHIYSIKYDFIALRQIEFRKIPLETVDCIVTGDLIYPPASLVPNRNCHGVRVMWNKGEPISFRHKWNPFNNDIPFLTFTSHPLYMHSDSLDEKRRSIYGLEEFLHCLIEAVENALIARGLAPCIVQHKEIMLQTYVGLGSLIHNRNALGFFKVRGKFSF